MTAKQWMGIAGAVAMLGFAAPAFAHGDDDHDQYHQELGQEHELQHEQLDMQHQQEHMREAEEHARLHAEGWGDDPFSHWLMHRRVAREHRMEHMREWLQHNQEHANANAEHVQYHQQWDPYAYGGYYYAPRYRTYR